MKLSIIIPCYNVTHYLLPCLESVFENTYRELELILVNDGSTDDWGGVLSNYFSHNCHSCVSFIYNDAEIKIIHQDNTGVSSARNIGIKVATGEYVIFIDPDDYVKKDYFSSIAQFIRRTENPDIIIMGFNQIVKDEKGNSVSRKEIFPLNTYFTNTVMESVKRILPYYLGYSVDNILRWSKEKCSLQSQREWGAVWRNIYRREFLIQNDIFFNTSIHLNEDSMFNARCFSFAEKVRTLNESFYCYTIRPCGALRKNRRAALYENKIALLNERTDIVENLRKRGFNYSIKDFAGSNVMSCFELAIKMPFTARRETRKYLSNPIVKDSIKIMPYAGMIKFDLPLFMLKHNLSILLLYVLNAINVMGIKIHL